MKKPTNRCSLPWQRIIISPEGNMGVCCWGYGNLGNLNSSSLESIWNGEQCRTIRKALVAGNYQGCLQCKHYHQDTLPPIELPNPESKQSVSLDNIRLNVEEYLEGKEVLKSLPVYCSLTLSHKCNINCTICWQRKNVSFSSGELSKNVIDLVEKYYKYAKILSLIGGEPLYIDYVLRFINDFDRSKYPNMELRLVTNGLLLNDAILSKLKKFSNVHFNFSIDSFNKDVYERIRKGGSFDLLMCNLEKVIGCAQKFGWTINIFYIVMKSTLAYMLDAIKLCRAKGITLSFTPIAGEGLRSENIFMYPNLLDGTNWQGIFEEGIFESYRFNDSKQEDGRLIRRTLRYLKTKIRS